MTGSVRHAEPCQGPGSATPVSRRQLLRAGGVGLVTASLAACDAFSTKPSGSERPNGDRGSEGTPGAMEAPQVAKQVKAGTLPKLADRLPDEPLVVKPTEKTGTYGGTWHTTILGPADTAWISRTMAYEDLTRWDPQWTTTILNVAKSIDVSRGGLVYTVGLRPGMKWSDGKPFGADDLVFGNNDVTLNSELTPVPPANPAHFEKLDDHTVKITFEKPDGFFLQHHADSGTISQPFHYLKQFHKKYNPDIGRLVKKEGTTDWVELFQRKGSTIEGTSYNALWMNPDLPTLCAWKPVARLGKGTRFVVKRNPYYWKTDPDGRQLPYIDEISYKIITDPQVMLLKATSGEFDMHDRHFNNPQNKPVLARNRKKAGYDFFDNLPASMNNLVVALNLSHPDPKMREVFGNKDFRIGLSHAIDRQQMIDAVFQRQGEPWQLGPRKDSGFYLEALAKQYTDYDLKKANGSLDQAGYSQRNGDGWRLRPDGKPIAFSIEMASGLNPFWTDGSQLIRDYWRKVGVDVQIRNEDRSLLYNRKENNQHDAIIWGGDGGLRDAILDPRWYFPYTTESNYATAWANWYNGDKPAMKPPPETRKQMKLYDQIKETPGEDDRKKLFMQILQIAQEQFYAIGTVLPAPGYGIVKNNFHNVPKSMPGAWIYPNPAPTNPEQYYISQG